MSPAPTQTKAAEAAAAKLAAKPAATPNAKPAVKKGRKPACKHPLADNKTCGLGQGHAGDHRPRQTVKRETTGLDVEMLSAVQAPPAQVDQRTAPARARNELQQAVDKVVAGKHAQWVAAGKPTQWGKIPRDTKGMYTIKPERAETVRAMLRSSGEFLKLRIRFGTPVRVGPTFPDGTPNPDAGKEIIVFAVMDRSESKTKTETK